MEATCQCGQLRATLPGPSPVVVACHCEACQRRTGAAFSVNAYYPETAVTIVGEAKRYERPAASGAAFGTFFCATCGSSVYMIAGKHPGLIGIAVGTVADPDFPPPVRSVWEERMHRWVAIGSARDHFPQGRD